MKYQNLLRAAILCVALSSVKVVSAQELHQVRAKLLEQSTDIMYRNVHKIPLTDEQSTLTLRAEQLEQQHAQAARTAYEKNDHTAMVRA